MNWLLMTILTAISLVCRFLLTCIFTAVYTGAFVAICAFISTSPEMFMSMMTYEALGFVAVILSVPAYFTALKIQGI